MRYGAVQRAPAYRCGQPKPKRGSDEVSEEIVVACGYHSAAVATHIKYLFYRRFGSCGHLLGGFGVGQEYILVGRDGLGHKQLDFFTGRAPHESLRLHKLGQHYYRLAELPCGRLHGLCRAYEGAREYHVYVARFKSLGQSLCLPLAKLVQRGVVYSEFRHIFLARILAGLGVADKINIGVNGFHCLPPFGFELYNVL